MTSPVLPCERDREADLDDYCDAMLRASDRVAEAVRTEDPAVLDRAIDDALRLPAPPGAPAAARVLIAALAVQVDTDVPWRERFAWTHDIAAVADPIPDPGPSSASYVSASACLDATTWGVAPSSNARKEAA